MTAENQKQVEKKEESQYVAPEEAKTKSLPEGRGTAQVPSIPSKAEYDEEPYWTR